MATIDDTVAAILTTVNNLQTELNNVLATLSSFGGSIGALPTSVNKIPITSLPVDLSPVTGVLTSIQNGEAGMVSQLTDIQHQLET